MPSRDARLQQQMEIIVAEKKAGRLSEAALTAFREAFDIVKEPIESLIDDIIDSEEAPKPTPRRQTTDALRVPALLVTASSALSAVVQ